MPILGKLKSDDDFDIFDIISNGEQTSEYTMMEGEQHEQLKKWFKSCLKNKDKY